MNKKPPSERSKVSAVGRVSLDEIRYMGEKVYTIGNMKWSVAIGKSTSHFYNEITVSTIDLEDEERLHVELEVYAPKCLPNRMTFWHVYDIERHAFCIPYWSDEVLPDYIQDPEEGQLQKGRPAGSYIRISLNPKIWKYKNWQFPFADLVLKIGNEELYVNRKILASSSRFFVYILKSKRIKCMRMHEVLHITDVSFEDLYDLMGCIYHGWMFRSERALHLQYIAEQFGVHLDGNNAWSFEGRTSMELVPLSFHDERSQQESSKNDVPIQRRLRKLSTTTGKYENVPDPGNDPDNNLAEGQEESDFNSRSSSSFSSTSVIPNGSISPIEEERRAYRNSPHPEPMELGEGPSTQSDGSDSSDNEDDFEKRRLQVDVVPGKTNSQKTAVRDGRLSYEFTFGYNPCYTETYLNGGKYAMRTCFGCWDIYFYSKMINSERYLALGLYGTRISPTFINSVMLSVGIPGGNWKPTKKIIQKVMSSDRNTLGYPNFMRWSEVENNSNEDGTIEFSVQLSAALLNETVLPELTYDMFPGRKDTFVGVDGIVFPVSKDVLSEASPIFKGMFDEELVINRRQVYVIDNISYKEFMILLDFIYNKKSRLIRENYVDIMEQAARFQMYSVMDQICRDMVYLEEMEEGDAIACSLRFRLKTFMYKYYSQTTKLEHNESSLIRKAYYVLA